MIYRWIQLQEPIPEEQYRKTIPVIKEGKVYFYTFEASSEHQEEIKAILEDRKDQDE